jgi:hypothetical protein
MAYKKHTKNFVWNTRRKHNLTNIGVDGSIILKWVLQQK